MENNKLIAEFMGFQKTNIGWYDSEEIMPPLSNTYDSNTFDEHELAFHKSWDWLMPVVDRIEGIIDEHGCAKYNVRIEQSWVDIIDNHTSDEIVKVDGDNRREATYKAVVEFINQYNK